jgi:hypothetical protein
VSKIVTDRRAALVAASLVAVGLVQAYLFRDLRLDDAYITYRYAQNLVGGNGFVFNSGERVLGTTAPGHALLAALALLASTADALPTVMACLGAIGWSLQALVLWRWFAAEGDEHLGIAVAACIAMGAARSYAWTPLETNLAAAASIASLYLFMCDRFTLGGALLAVAILLRPDAVLVVVPLAVLAWQKRVRPLLAVVAAAAPVLAWAIFAKLYFGSPFPSTLSKAGAVSFGVYARHVFESLPTTLAGVRTGVWGSAVLWGVAVYGAFSLWMKNRGARALVVYFVAFITAYLVLRTNPAFGWHLYPAHLTFTLFVVAAVMRGPLALVSLWKATRGATAAAVVSVVLVAFLATAAARGSLRFAQTYRSSFWYGARDDAYHAAGEFLRDAVGPDEVVLSEEVGTLAFVSGRKFHDYPGLVAPEAFSRSVRGAPGELFEYVRHEHYRWIVMTSPQQLRFHSALLDGAEITHFPLGHWDIRIAHLKDIQ